jgi:hypothetical protein
MYLSEAALVLSSLKVIISAIIPATEQIRKTQFGDLYKHN